MEDQQLIQLALSHKVLTHAQLKLAKEEQRALADRGLERSLWFVVQEMGYVTEEQSRKLRSEASSAHHRALEVEGYVVQGRIGSGGMGDVFRGKRADGEEAAIKLLSSKFSSDAEYAQRFKREAQATLRLSHPHITRSISDGEVDGHRYLIMELVNGPSLRSQIQTRGKLGEREALTLIAQMADALGYAWSNGVLHRDVKPANMILGQPRPGVNEPFCAKICDFGLAKVWQTGRYTIADLTKSGVALGTPHYMSPEQAAGETDLDQRSDIYSLGATVYHALLGQTMYSGKSSAVIMYKHVNEALDLQPLRDAGVAEDLVRLLGKMLAKERTGRFPDWNVVLSEARAGLRVRTGKPTSEAVVSPRAVEVLARAGGAASPAKGAVALADPPATRTPTPAPAQVPLPSREPTPRSSPRASAAALAAAPAVPSRASSPAVAAPPQVVPTALATADAPSRAAPPSSGQSSAAQGSRMRRLRRQLVIRLGLVSLAIAGLAAGAFVGLVGRAGSSVRADPSSLTRVLAEAARADRATTVVLAPGDYRGPWRFGVAQSRLRVRGGGTGVRLVGGAGETTVQLQAGLHDFALEGVAIVPNGGVAIEALAVASARLEQITVDGACAATLAASGSQLVVRGLHADGGARGVDLDGGSLTLSDALVRAKAPALRAHHARFELRRCRFAAASGQSVIALDGGGGSLGSVVVEATGCAQALAVDGVEALDLVDVALVGARAGLVVDGSRLPMIDGLSVEAAETGLSWSGSRDPSWHWSRLDVRAPRAADGVDGLALVGGGARDEALKLVPASLP